MRVQREIRDERLARFLQTAEEATLREAMDSLVTDRELVEAIRHSERHDDSGEGQSVERVLESIDDAD